MIMAMDHHRGHTLWSIIGPTCLVMLALVARVALGDPPPALATHETPAAATGETTSSEPATPVLHPPALPLRPEFAADPLWDDGNAEINVYEAVEVRYGRPRLSQVIQIVVKEDLLPGTWVKADDWRTPGVVPVLKLNWVLDVPTGVYSYRQMVSLFMRRSDLALVKETLTSHEWCGNTWKGLVATSQGLELEYRTYWEGEAAGTRRLDWPAGTIVADSLPLVVRALPLAAERGGGRKLGEAPMAPSLIGSRVGSTTPSPATFAVAWRAPLPQGPPGILAALVTVTTPAGAHRMWIESSLPHRLLRWERPDGAIYRLVRSRRLPYWDLNAPGDGARLEEGLLFDPPLGPR